MFKQINWPKIFFIAAVCFFISFFVRGASALFSTDTTNAANTFSTGFWVTPSESELTPTTTPSLTPTLTDTTPSPTITLTPTPTITLTPTPTITSTPTPTTTISSQTIIINELMWMGSSMSTADEWIELKNTTSSAIDLSGWKLVGAGGTGGIISIPSGKTISANGFFLVANDASSSSILAVEPDVQTTSVSLSNSALQVVLKNTSDTIIDTAWNGLTPTVGSNVVPKKSMERNATPGDGALTTNWHTSTGSINFDPGATELGTPKAENSL